MAMEPVDSLIRDYWPDFEFDTKDYRDGKIEFLLRLFEAFVADINDKISFLMYEECVDNKCLDFLKKYDERVLLYCRVRYFLKKINTIPFHIGDLYFKNPKTMKVHVQSAMHFLIYLNNKVDVFFNSTVSAMSLVSEEEHLNKLLEEQMQKRANIAEELGLLNIRLPQQLVELVAVKEEHENMVKDKSDLNKLFAQQSLEVARMEFETTNLEYELKLLEEKETQLESQVVPNEECSNLLRTQTFLQKQLADLSQQCFDTVDFKKISNEIRQIEAYDAKLKRLTLDLDKTVSKNLPKIKRDVKDAEAAKEQNIFQLEKFRNLHSSKALKVKLLEDSLYKAENSYKHLQEETLADERLFKIKIDEITERYVSDSKKHDENEKQKHLVQKETSRFREAEEALEKTMSEEYSKVLVKYGQCTSHFHDILKKVDVITKPHNS